MKIQVWIERENKKMNMEVKDSSTVFDVFKSLGITMSEGIPKVNGKFVPQDYVLKENDGLEIKKVK